MIRPYSVVVHMRTLQVLRIRDQQSTRLASTQKGSCPWTAAACKVYSGRSMGLPASSRHKGPAAAKTGCQKEDETRSHREHVCSASYLLGTEHARSSGTRSTRLYQEMRRGGAGHRLTGSWALFCRPAHFTTYYLGIPGYPEQTTPYLLLPHCPTDAGTAEDVRQGASAQ